MISVDQLSKYYGDFLAVDRISFEVPAGEVVGILGPNGAGKTTLIRMLTCFMPATSGRASVNGFDIFTHSLDVRRTVGYMPESVPLYDDLRVQEYLQYRGQLKGLAAGYRKKKVEEVLERCQLLDRRRQLIGTLSKGYRQRVGLADALLADPKVLVLDEPTIGLDPSQIREVRKMIHDLGETHTVLLSSHILPEVEQICGHIIMIAAGKVVANGRLDELKRSIAGNGSTQLQARPGPGSRVDAEGLRLILARLHGVRDVQLESADGLASFTIVTSEGQDVREALGEAAIHNGWAVRELHTTRPTLEDFFVKTIAEQNLSRAGAKADGLVRTAV